MKSLFTMVLVASSLLGAQCFQQAKADGFAALVSPPRIEDDASSGKTYRNIIDFYNVSNERGQFSAQTADWIFDSKTLNVEFTEKLQEGSCRPWVYLESPTIDLPAQGKKRYRLEVRVPENTPAQECRFAILFTGSEASQGDVVVSGQLAVVVYLRIDGAQADLHLVDATTKTESGVKVPALVVKNTGNASTRLEGYITRIDSQGKEILFLPKSYPVLPQRTDTLALIPQGINDKTPAPQVSYPVHLKGTIVWGQSKMNIDQSVE